jgi:hypothetical protein
MVGPMFARLLAHVRNNAVGFLALFVALGGTSAYAVNEWNGSNIQDETLTGADVRGKYRTTTVAGVNGSLTGADISGQEAITGLGQPYVNGTISGWDVTDNTIQGRDITESTLGQVPSAATADSLKAPEAWREVGTAGQPGFAVYSGGIGQVWENFDSGHSSVAFFKDRQGVVHLKGLARRTASELCGGVVYVFFLPPGYRPAVRSVFTSLRNGGLARVNVDGDGSVMLDLSVGPSCTPVGEWLSLEGITFRAV